jgi:hypothetical protein
MLYNNDFRNHILIEPIRCGADKLKIISGYATHTMASWHITEIASKFQRPIDISLVVGMCVFDGISIDVHEGFNNIIARNNTQNQSNLTCQYVCEGAPVHSKLYLWEKNERPFLAFMGSANYSQTAFSSARRELLSECNPAEALEYYESIERDTIYSNHAEVQDYIKLTQKHSILEAEDSRLNTIRGAGMQSIKLSLLSISGDVGEKSGLNWGQRDGREPNQAYIPLPALIARSNFFPLEKKHFSVLTDDSKQLILRVEQQNNKAITTPLNNSLLGEYFRNRIGAANGAFITKNDLLNYGRTDVTFYKLDDEQYFMDFSV